MMDATLGKSEAELCRCCCKANNILDSLFEHSEMEITIDKILNILAPIAIGRNDGNLILVLTRYQFIHDSFSRLFAKDL